MTSTFIHKDLTFGIIGAAMEVHRLLGPGFLESVYDEALAHELSLRHLEFERQVALQVRYKGAVVGDYKADYVVEATVLVELKATTGLHMLHEAQVLNYLAATGLQLGLLLNFGGERLEFRRFIDSRRNGRK